MKRKLFALTTVVLLLIGSVLPAFASQAWMEQEARLYHVTDTVGILDEDEMQALEAHAESLSTQYEVGIYLAVVDDFRYYVSEGTWDIFDAAVEIYQEYSLGLGEGKDGLLLLMSMDDRDYSLVTYGDRAEYAFSDEGRPLMTRFFLDDFGEDEWYDGLADFLNWCEKYLDSAEQGKPYSESNPPMSEEEIKEAIAIRLGAIVLIPLVVAGIAVLVLNNKMKSVAKAVEAEAYVNGGLDLDVSMDCYTHTTETRRRIEKESDSGGRNSKSGGFSGTSGKF